MRYAGGVCWVEKVVEEEVEEEDGKGRRGKGREKETKKKRLRPRFHFLPLFVLVVVNSLGVSCLS